MAKEKEQAAEKPGLLASLAQAAMAATGKVIGDMARDVVAEVPKQVEQGAHEAAAVHEHEEHHERPHQRIFESELVPEVAADAPTLKRAIALAWENAAPRSAVKRAGALRGRTKRGSS